MWVLSMSALLIGNSLFFPPLLNLVTEAAHDEEDLNVGGDEQIVNSLMLSLDAEDVAQEIDDSSQDEQPSAVQAIVDDVKSFFGEVNYDWFEAKDWLMFDKISAKALGKVKEAPAMLNLVHLRSKFLCMVIFGAKDEFCLFTKGRSNRVTIPAKIAAVGDLSTNVEFTDSEQRCAAEATGSVSYLSDLDFTVFCSEATNGTREQAWDEVMVAEKLTEAVVSILNAQPGTIFDTNFYTNTFSYGKALGKTCAEQPAAGIALALYAAARGFRAMSLYAEKVGCESFSGKRIADPFQVPSSESFGDFFQSIIDRLKKTSVLTPLMGRLNRINKGAYHNEGELSKHLQSYVSEVTAFENIDEYRNEWYYMYLKESLGGSLNNQQVWEGTDLVGSVNMRFCSNIAKALILANEAYWVEGAITDIVLRKADLSIQEGVESILMNLGYAMEHVTEQFERGDKQVENPETEGIAKCNYGDGLVKFGKYMVRVIKTLDHIDLTKSMPDTDDVLREGKSKKGKSEESMTKKGVFTNAEAMMKFKDDAKEAEKNDALANPKSYLDAYQQLMGDAASFRNHEPLARCGFLDKVAKASKTILEHALKNWA